MINAGASSIQPGVLPVVVHFVTNTLHSKSQ
jgi:hypothetical protein